jgi:hypothetical protein
LLICLTVLGACAGGDRAPVEVGLGKPDTLVRAEGQLLAHPADLAVDESGNVYVSDGQAGRVVVIAPATGTSRFIGREGRGPGELQQPWGLGIAGDTLRVVNTGNLRVEVFTTAGAFVRSDPLSLMARAAPTDFAADGRMAAASYGIQDSALVRVYARDGTSLTGVGELLVPPAGGFDVTAIKDAIAKGDVPEMFRNFTRPRVTPDGGLWAILTAEGAVRRYDTAGRLLWSVPLEAPELPH